MLCILKIFLYGYKIVFKYCKLTFVKDFFSYIWLLIDCVELKDEEIMDFNKEFLSLNKFSENKDLEYLLDNKNVGASQKKGKSFIY